MPTSLFLKLPPFPPQNPVPTAAQPPAPPALAVVAPVPPLALTTAVPSTDTALLPLAPEATPEVKVAGRPTVILTTEP
jgi:hypothetical protein